jgi:hypothetical protein
VLNYFLLLSGGLRYAATTGYYLTALQAEPSLPARGSVLSGFLNVNATSKRMSFHTASAGGNSELRTNHDRPY